MIDGVIKGIGNSATVKSVSNFLSLYPTYEDFVGGLVGGTVPVDLTYNNSGWEVVGTTLNKTSLLTDTTAALLDLYGDRAVPDEAFSTLLSRSSWKPFPPEQAVGTIQFIGESGVHSGVSDLLVYREQGDIYEMIVVSHAVNFSDTLRRAEIVFPPDFPLFSVVAGTAYVGEAGDDGQNLSRVTLPIAYANTVGTGEVYAQVSLIKSFRHPIFSATILAVRKGDD